MKVGYNDDLALASVSQPMRLYSLLEGTIPMVVFMVDGYFKRRIALQT
jgi:hypothetical protein